VSARSLSKWSRGGALPRPRGRPRTSAARREEASDLVLAAWRAQGQSGGVRTIRAALDDAVSWVLVRQCLAEIKRLHGARRRAHLVEHRLSAQVCARDVMWSMDGTHLARLPNGEPVEGQVVRETATPKILAAEIGPPADGDDVVRLLERVAQERGCLPLVLVTDNGSIYTCGKVEEWLAAHGVVHLLSLPHTPRHNPWVERTHRELKDETGLGKGAVVQDAGEVRERVDEARCRLDYVRLRARLGYTTAAAADAALTAWYDRTTRERFLAAVCRRIAEALPGLCGKRAERKARREAIYASMEEFGLIKRTRGGR
jgi:transposase InsO family protein